MTTAAPHRQARAQRTVAQEVRDLRRLKLKKEKLSKDAKKAAEDFDKAERALMMRLEAEELESVRSGGILYSPTRTTYSHVQNPDEFIPWAEEHAPELLETKHRKGLLHELVRQRLDDNEPLPPGVGFYVDEYISQRAA